ncbi:hypothetical protein NMS89_003755, partial [Vibrio cholerae]|nr:hypothetical protein [Vibrio cholerae]
LNEKTQEIFQHSLKERNKLGELHHQASCIYEVSEILRESEERDMLVKVSVQLESANFNITLGLYRQAFTSLRLAFEMGLAAIYFSANKLELHEWLHGKADIKWSKLIDEDNGVLSLRYSRAFFKECENEAFEYRSNAKWVYRSLSEYVHGNSETWTNGIIIRYNDELFKKYCDLYKDVTDIILFC